VVDTWDVNEFRKGFKAKPNPQGPLGQQLEKAEKVSDPILQLVINESKSEVG